MVDDLNRVKGTMSYIILSSPFSKSRANPDIPCRTPLLGVLKVKKQKYNFFKLLKINFKLSISWNRNYLYSFRILRVIRDFIRSGFYLDCKGNSDRMLPGRYLNEDPSGQIQMNGSPSYTNPSSKWQRVIVGQNLRVRGELSWRWGWIVVMWTRAHS